MRVDETLGPDDLDRPDWNSLLNNYSKHDIGEAYFVGRAEEMGMHVQHWGIDRRHEDENLIFDNKMDIKLWQPHDGQEPPLDWPDDDTEFIETTFDLGFEKERRAWSLRALVDVKTKANEDWMGKFNLRHLAHYTMHAAEYQAPAFVYMTMVDVDAQSVGRSNIIAPIPTDWNWELLVDYYHDDADLSYGEIKDIARESNLVKSTFRAPDGNLVISMNDRRYIDFKTFRETVQ